MPLTPKEQVFVSQYLIDFNGKRAAMMAGYKPAAAESSAVRLLAKPHIQEAIVAAQSVALVQTQIRAEAVLQGLAAIGFADITDYLDERGRLKPTTEWPKNAGKLIASVKTKQYVEGTGDDAKPVETVEIKLWDKVAALDKLAKHFGLLIERQEATTEHKLKTMTEAELRNVLNEAVKAGILQSRNAIRQVS